MQFQRWWLISYVRKIVGLASKVALDGTGATHNIDGIVLPLVSVHMGCINRWSKRNPPVQSLVTLQWFFSPVQFFLEYLFIGCYIKDSLRTNHRRNEDGNQADKNNKGEESTTRHRWSLSTCLDNVEPALRQMCPWQTRSDCVSSVGFLFLATSSSVRQTFLLSPNTFFWFVISKIPFASWPRK